MLGLLTGALPATAFAQIKSAKAPPKDDLIVVLRAKDLLFPVPGVDFNKLTDTFNEARGSKRVHHALDIPAPRGTPILSVDSGRVLKIHHSVDGGKTVYIADPSEHYIFFYAHLDHYAESLKEGEAVSRGDTIGYVGTSGNAPPNTPHLHFAILRSTNISKWSRGRAVDPYRVFLK